MGGWSSIRFSNQLERLSAEIVLFESADTYLQIQRKLHVPQLGYNQFVLFFVALLKLYAQLVSHGYPTQARKVHGIPAFVYNEGLYLLVFCSEHVQDEDHHW